MTIQAILRVVVRWWWLFLIGIALGLLGGYAAQVSFGAFEWGTFRTYSATATVSVGTEVQGLDQSNSELNLANSLVPTYVELARRPPITDRVVNNLNLTFSAGELVSAHLTVEQPERTQLIQITGKHWDAATAAAIANETALQLQQSAPIRPTRLIQTVSMAEVPMSFDASVYLLIGLGAVAGFLLALGLVLLIEFAFDRPYTLEWATSRFNLPILGTFSRRQTPGRPRLFGLLRGPDRVPNEAVWWAVMSSVDRAAGDNPQRGRSVVVTSPRATDSKTAAAVSLAATAAASGRKTILVDADIRQSRLRKWYGLGVQQGVSTLATNGYEEEEVGTLLVSDVLTGVTVLPAGPKLTGRSHISEDRFWRHMIDDLTSQADFVVINAPSMKVVPEVMPLVTKVDGVLETADLGRTTAPQINETQGVLDRAGAKVLGVIINRS